MTKKASTCPVAASSRIGNDNASESDCAFECARERVYDCWLEEGPRRRLSPPLRPWGRTGDRDFRIGEMRPRRQSLSSPPPSSSSSSSSMSSLSPTSISLSPLRAFGSIALILSVAYALEGTAAFGGIYATASSSARKRGGANLILRAVAITANSQTPAVEIKHAAKVRSNAATAAAVVVDREEVVEIDVGVDVDVEIDATREEGATDTDAGAPALDEIVAEAARNDANEGEECEEEENGNDEDDGDESEVNDDGVRRAMKRASLLRRAGTAGNVGNSPQSSGGRSSNARTYVSKAATRGRIGKGAPGQVLGTVRTTAAGAGGKAAGGKASPANNKGSGNDGSSSTSMISVSTTPVFKPSSAVVNTGDWRSTIQSVVADALHSQNEDRRPNRLRLHLQHQQHHHEPQHRGQQQQQRHPKQQYCHQYPQQRRQDISSHHHHSPSSLSLEESSFPPSLTLSVKSGATIVSVSPDVCVLGHNPLQHSSVNHRSLGQSSSESHQLSTRSSTQCSSTTHSSTQRSSTQSSSRISTKSSSLTVFVRSGARIISASPEVNIIDVPPSRPPRDSITDVGTDTSTLIGVLGDRVAPEMKTVAAAAAGQEASIIYTPLSHMPLPGTVLLAPPWWTSSSMTTATAATMDTAATADVVASADLASLSATTTPSSSSSSPLSSLRERVSRHMSVRVSAGGMMQSSSLDSDVIDEDAGAMNTAAASTVSERRDLNSGVELDGCGLSLDRSDEDRIDSVNGEGKLPNLLGGGIPTSGAGLIDPDFANDVHHCRPLQRPELEDDRAVANLRLSVFNDFDEVMQDQFRYRSMEVLRGRRRRGATVLVAEVPGWLGENIIGEQRRQREQGKIWKEREIGRGQGETNGHSVERLGEDEDYKGGDIRSWGPAPRVNIGATAVVAAAEARDNDEATTETTVSQNEEPRHPHHPWRRQWLLPSPPETPSSRRMMNASSISTNNNIIVGSAECSHHEFRGTLLGNSRPLGSIMYVTEVAVRPEVRRYGFGRALIRRQLMHTRMPEMSRSVEECQKGKVVREIIRAREGIMSEALDGNKEGRGEEIWSNKYFPRAGVDEVAKLRNVDTVYLHVDVSNRAACDMYEKAGYQYLNKAEPLYAQFTASLNLHDGASPNGRCHHLMCKNVTAMAVEAGG